MPLAVTGWSLVVLDILVTLFLIFPAHVRALRLFSAGVIAFTMQMIGTACLQDNLIGVENCDKTFAVAMLTFGSGTMAFDLIVAAAIYIFQTWEEHQALIAVPSFVGITGVATGSVGWSCLVDTLAGGCNKSIGLWVI